MGGGRTQASTRGDEPTSQKPVGHSLSQDFCHFCADSLIGRGGDVLGAVGPLGGGGCVKFVKLGTCDLARTLSEGR